MVLVVPPQKVVAAAVVLGAVPLKVPAASPVNVLPPIPVTSGMLAGASTAGPWVAVVADAASQSPAPESPDAAVMVCPCALACCASCSQGLHEAGQMGLAIPVTGADDRRQIVVDGEGHGVEDVLGGRVGAGVHVENRGFFGDRV